MNNYIIEETYLLRSPMGKNNYLAYCAVVSPRLNDGHIAGKRTDTHCQSTLLRQLLPGQAAKAVHFCKRA